jgi:G6PDH family F420-dependent oxidoreductase
VAQAFATLAVLYPGRVFTGVGTGEALNELPAGGGWGPHRERLGRLDEAVRLIRRLWTGERVDFQGEYYRVEGARLYDTPSEPPPLYIAASGPRTAGLAGREGDGWITDIATARRGQAPVREAFEREARLAGKDPVSMPVLTELWAVVGSREEALEAAKKWRFIPAFNDVVGVASPHEVERVAEERVSLEQAASGWVISRDLGDHVEAIRALGEAGVTDVLIHPPQDDQGTVLDFYEREVLPALVD